MADRASSEYLTESKINLSKEHEIGEMKHFA